MNIQYRRPRRTNHELEIDILEATRQEIIEKGFTRLTVVGIAKRAGIEPSVFYKRYKDLHELLTRYVQKYDYWHSSFFTDFESVPPANYGNYVKEAFASMAKFLIEDRSMQELILWEFIEDNDITRNTNQMREEHTHFLANTLEKYFHQKGIRINFRVFSAIVLSAIYFIIIHKGKATFCNIDFKSSEGQAALISTVTDMIDGLFLVDEKQTNRIAIARKMKEKGIDTATIAECTEVDRKVIDRL